MSPIAHVCTVYAQEYKRAVFKIKRYIPKSILSYTLTINHARNAPRSYKECA